MQVRFIGRLAISLTIAAILITIIWVTSQFREPPRLNAMLVLLLAIIHATFELIFWMQNRFLAPGFDRLSTWQISKYTLFTIGAGAVFYTILFYGFKWIDFHMGSEWPHWTHIRLALLVGLTLSIIFTLVLLAVRFNKAHYQHALRHERAQNELTQANLALLTHQLDPHFLFNNFNTLYYLIDEDTVLAKAFLKNMADIYRHILQSKERSLLSAQQEYQVARQYLAILRQRYGNALVVHDTIVEKKLVNKFLPPLVVQQLLENIVKHNQLDLSKPLSIALTNNDDCLTIENAKLPKNIVNSTGIGLSNIIARYQHLSPRKVHIEDNITTFSVTIPLLDHA